MEATAAGGAARAADPEELEYWLERREFLEEPRMDDEVHIEVGPYCGQYGRISEVRGETCIVKVGEQILGPIRTVYLHNLSANRRVNEGLRGMAFYLYG